MLSDLQRAKLTRYFWMYDVDEDGEIGPRDFARVLENIRILYRVPDHSLAFRLLKETFSRRWEGLRQSADADHDGGVDLGEWLAYFDQVLSDEDRYREEIASVTSSLLAIFDTDEDGRLGPDEFSDFYGAYGQPASLARQIFVDLDEDGDGAISRQELVDMADEFFHSDDPSSPGNRLFGPFEE